MGLEKLFNNVWRSWQKVERPYVHRLATIKNADRIIVVTEDGLTEDLMREELRRRNKCKVAYTKAI